MARWAERTSPGKRPMGRETPSKGRTAMGQTEWVDCTREKSYHLLCSHLTAICRRPSPHLWMQPSAARSALASGLILIADAGRDANNTRLREWGQRSQMHPRR